MMEITTLTSVLPPSLIFDHTMGDTITLTEGKTFSFSARLRSNIGSQDQSIQSFYTFNEDPNVRAFDSCDVHRMGDQIVFVWTPSDKEARKKYAKFRITLIDNDGAILNSTLNFKLINVNQPPYFKTILPDTLLVSQTRPTTLDLMAIDPDGDNLSYDYSPKGGFFTIQNGELVIEPENPSQFTENPRPGHLSITVSDGKHSLQKTIVLIRNKYFGQPVIGDFTRKQFYEGDSLITYLNLSDDGDLNQLDIQYRDMAQPPGIQDLSNRLVFEKRSSYIKVFSKGILPYTLVNRDHIYNIGITITSKSKHWRPVSKVLELTVEDRPDPAGLVQQRDAVLNNVTEFLRIEKIYKTELDKIYNRISRPWWKKVAIATGALSGVLLLIQSQDQNKSVSTISAGISLVSIMVANIPGLSEKTLADLNDKISSSKARTERLQDKESEFRTTTEFGADRIEFDRMKAELEQMLTKSETRRNEDICSLLENKNVRRRIDKLKSKDATKDVKRIFKCAAGQNKAVN
jgi:hypothetical protein